MSNGNKENEQCKWYVTHTPYGFPVYATECGKMGLSCATGIDVYCNACGKKIKIIDDTKVGGGGEMNEQYSYWCIHIFGFLFEKP